MGRKINIEEVRGFLEASNRQFEQGGVSRFHTGTEQHLTHKKQERRNKYEKRDTV